ncbi:MAG: T9SS type A sorting domain-containing protein [Saprospiraceae bacterium]
MTYVRNLGHSGSFDYEVTRFDSLGISDFVPESVFMPELVDLDQDGDLDLLMSGFDPAFAVEDGSDVPKYYYAKNIGTATAPQFEGWYENPYGLTANPLKEFTSAGDIDNDGDIDILASTSDIPSDSINKLYVHLNTPDVNGKPSFTSTLTSPYNLPETFGDNQLFFPNLVDIDGDGDLDLFVFEGTATGLELYYFENSLCTSTVIQTDVDLCVGDSVVIGGIAYFDEGDYVLSVPGPNGCDSVIMLTINQLPDVNNSVDLNGIVLTANLFNADYQWFDCNSGVNVPGATSQVFIASSSGNYAVRITDASGCVGVSACFSIFIDGVENTSLSNAISIYPDPSDDFIYLENTTQYPVTSITIRSVFGLNMGDIKVRGNKAIDVSFLGKGIYFVQMNINGYVVIKKLIVN